MLLQLSHFTPFIPLRPLHPVPPTFPHLTSCPWVLHISSLPSPFPILFLPSPCLFATYHLCYLFSIFSPILLPPTFPPYSSCPWVIVISSLASPFPILFLPSPCLFSIYHLCYLFPVPFPPSPHPTPPSITLHVISISVVLFLF